MGARDVVDSDVTLPTDTSIICALCYALVAEPSLRVPGPTTGYRCKATYSMYPPPLVTSPLASQLVNDLCLAVAGYIDQRDQVNDGARLFYVDHPKFVWEVCAKVTREGAAMIKIAFVNDCFESEVSALDGCARDGMQLQCAVGAVMTLFEYWYNHTDEPQEMFHFLKTRFPTLQCIVAHVQLHGENVAQKPDKSSCYLPITAAVADRRHAPLHVTELTPNGVPFRLFADSFCEVNHAMEDAMFHTIVEFLRLDQSPKAGNGRRAFISGRDINSVTKTFAQYYTATTSVTSCPNVFSDAALNKLEDVHHTTKDSIHGYLDAFCCSTKDSEDAARESHVLITAGRHGLHPSTTHALSRLAGQGPGRLHHVVYVSCNKESFARDMHIMKQGLRIEHARTFDFFPGTAYVMAVVHLTPIVPRCGESTSPSTNGDLLVLPVGPPGSGKSTCGRALKRFFSSDPKASPAKLRKKREKKTCTPQQPHVPREFASVVPNITVEIFERDLVFHRLREAGLSLKKAKVMCHEDLMQSLHNVHASPICSTAAESVEAEVVFPARRVLILDSTNGCAEARGMYTSVWNGVNDTASKASVFASSLTLLFRETCSREVLLERVGQRQGHPCFPSDVPAQQQKIDVIARSIEWPHDTLTSCDATGAVYSMDGSSTVDHTIMQALTVVSAYLHLSARLASLLVPAAVGHVKLASSPPPV